MRFQKQTAGKWSSWVVCLILGVAFCIVFRHDGYSQDKVYEPTWESLRQHSVPQWLKDAKFGLWTHWGPYAVMGKHALYSKMIYTEPSYREYHENAYGPLEKVGYHDLISRFTAEQFDAERWAELFERAGARFAGPVAEHCDGFAMWETEYSRWNAMRMGPKRDILAELADSIRDRGMKFVTSFHHFRKWWHYEPSYTSDNRYHTKSPEYAGLDGLYPPPHKKGEKAPESYFKMCMGKVREVIDRFHPSLLFFDSGPFSNLHENGNWFENSDFTPRFKQGIAHYYNQAHERGDHVAILAEQHDLPRDYLNDVGVRTLEQKRLDAIPNKTWIMMATVDNNGWGYKRNPDYKSAKKLLRMLVDVVSKNGVLWLNLGPKADGTIPKPQKQRILEMGKWLRQNGKAIYGTRPWEKSGNGENLRFTQSNDGDALYVIALNWPGDRLSPESIQVQSSRNGTVRMLGHDLPLEYEVSDGRVDVNVPDLPPEERPNKYAYVFKLTGFDGIQAGPVNRSLSYGKPATASNVHQNQVSEYGPSRAVDGNMDTRWATDGGARSPWVEIDLKQPAEINRVKIAEAFAGRVQSHSLEYRRDGQWKTIYRGDTIGSSFERQFDPVTTSKVRLNIHDATNGPTIREIWLSGPDE